MKSIALICFALIVLALCPTAQAKSPTGWSPIILPLGDYREEIQSMPIHQRPGRPFHVYGNAVRFNDHPERFGTQYPPVRYILFGLPGRR